MLGTRAADASGPRSVMIDRGPDVAYVPHVAWLPELACLADSGNVAGVGVTRLPAPAGYGAGP